MSDRRRPPRLLLVTGMSGAGKSTVLDALEDMGWDVVDNLPADLVFDLRFIPNPHWIEELRPLTGIDRPVRDYLEQDPSWGDAMERIESLLIDWIPRYWAAGKSYVTVAFGCTGGRHRSVAAAVEMAERLAHAGFAPNVRHRDLDSPPGDTIEADPGASAETKELNE